jgi:spermidine synthase
MGSKKYHPLRDQQPIRVTDTKYYTEQVHKAAFALPRFVEELIQK